MVFGRPSRTCPLRWRLEGCKTSWGICGAGWRSRLVHCCSGDGGTGGWSRVVGDLGRGSAVYDIYGEVWVGWVRWGKVEILWEKLGWLVVLT